MVGDRLVLFLILALKFVSDSLSKSRRTNFGRFIGRALMGLSKKRKNITLNNLTKAFPEKGKREIESICKKSYENLGITFIELLHLEKLKKEEAELYCNFKNLEIIQEYKSKGRGLVMLSAHYGNWEYLAYSAGLLSGVPLNMVVKPQKNELVDKKLNSFRSKSNNNMINMYEAARDIYATLIKKNILAMMVDQSATKDKDAFVNFFGRKASVYLAPAKLALKNNTPMLMGLAKRNNDGNYEIFIEEIKSDDLSNNPEDILELTKRHVKYLEDKIREHPELWSWQHNRWKHEPNA